MDLSHTTGVILSFVAGLLTGAMIFLWVLGWAHQEGVVLVKGQDFIIHVEKDDNEQKPQ